MNEVRFRGFLLMTQEEVIQELTKYYADMIPSNVEIISSGYSSFSFPTIILDKGIANMTPLELCSIAEPWAEQKLEDTEKYMKETNDIGRPPIMVIMTVLKGDGTYIPYIMNPNIYQNDFAPFTNET